MTQIDKSMKIVKADGKSVVMKIEDINSLDFFFPIDGSLLQDVQPANKVTHKWTLMEIMEKVGNVYDLWDEPDEGLYIFDAKSSVLNPVCKTGMTKAELTGNVLYVGDLDRIELEVLYNSISCCQMRNDFLVSADDYVFFAGKVENDYEIIGSTIAPLNNDNYTPEELTDLCGGSHYFVRPLPVKTGVLLKMMVYSETPDATNNYFNTAASIIARRAIYGPAAMISINHLDNII